MSLDDSCLNLKVEYPVRLIEGDCLEILRTFDDNHFDLVMTSPPYEDARTYGIDFKLKGQDWVDWAAERYKECVRVCKGLVCWVVEGKTRKFRYSATPALLMADLHRSGVWLRKPPVFKRVGIPGSGGPDWWRNDWEWCICSSKGKLPWSNNTANGHPPKWAPGGQMSNRHEDGRRINAGLSKQNPRVNQWGHSINSGATVIEKDGRVRSRGRRPSHEEPKIAAWKKGTDPRPGKLHTKNDGDGMREQLYIPPKKANAGNVIECIVGGGVMGSKLAHENEAPFPEKLVEPFVKCFCPFGGIVLDPFAGSGTTLAVAKRLGRRAVGIDVRASQVELSGRRINE